MDNTVQGGRNSCRPLDRAHHPRASCRRYSNHFNELERGLPHMSRALLVERFRRLERSGVLERRALSRGKQTECRLTPAGRELQRLIDILGEWRARWAFGDPRPNELDPIILLWWMRRRVALDAVPRRRVVIEFDFRGGPKQKYWLLIQPTDVSVCLKQRRPAPQQTVPRRSRTLPGCGIIRPFPGSSRRPPVPDR
jgi:DNA-binding HxlR family transcriptional regulator